MTLGEKIRQLREGKYTQEELAELLNVHNVTISKWENGLQSPNSKRVTELARILGTTTEYLLGQSESPPLPEPHTQERNTNMATITLNGGGRAEAPATPEGYAFLKELFAMSMGEQIQAIANLAGKNPKPQTESWVSPLGQLGRTSPAVNQ